MTERMLPERGSATIQSSRRSLREQHSMWGEGSGTPQTPATYRIARASLPVQDRQRPPQQGASRHHDGNSHAIRPEDQPYLTDDRGNGGGGSRLPTRGSSAIDEGLDDVKQPYRSARCYRHTATTEQQTAPDVYARRGYQMHGSVYIGLVLLCMLVGFVLFSALATWWQHTDDYLHYGMPRTFQMDAVVGHQDSAAHPSHFIALNLDGHLSVIEMQGGDLSKTVIYAGPVIYGQGSDLVAVTLSVVHDQHGQPELVLHYQNNEVILSDGKDGKFHLQPQ
jgi:hypothetical protein